MKIRFDTEYGRAVHRVESLNADSRCLHRNEPGTRDADAIRAMFIALRENANAWPVGAPARTSGADLRILLAVKMKYEDHFYVRECFESRERLGREAPWVERDSSTRCHPNNRRSVPFAASGRPRQESW